MNLIIHFQNNIVSKNLNLPIVLFCSKINLVRSRHSLRTDAYHVVAHLYSGKNKDAFLFAYIIINII